MTSQKSPLRGEFLESAGHAFDGEPDRTTNLESLLHDAPATTRSQHARPVEFRAARDCADALRDKRRCTKADNRLASVYGRFMEGFEDANPQRHHASSACW